MNTIANIINNEYFGKYAFMYNNEKISYTYENIVLDNGMEYSFVTVNRKHKRGYIMVDYFVVYNGKRGVVTGYKEVLNVVAFNQDDLKNKNIDAIVDYLTNECTFDYTNF